MEFMIKLKLKKMFKNINGNNSIIILSKLNLKTIVKIIRDTNGIEFISNLTVLKQC